MHFQPYLHLGSCTEVFYFDRMDHNCEGPNVAIKKQQVQIISFKYPYAFVVR